MTLLSAKQIKLVLFLLAFKVSAIAQTDTCKIALILRTELNQCHVVSSFYGTANTGFSLGIEYDYQYNAYTSIITGLDYQRKGGTGFVVFYNAVGQQIGGYNQNLYLHYAVVPLLLKIETKRNKKINFLAGVGGFYAFLLDAWVDPQDKELKHEVIKDYNRNEMGIITMLGVSCKITKQHKLSLEWRYTMGLTSVSSIYSGSNQSNGVSLSYNFVYQK